MKKLMITLIIAGAVVFWNAENSCGQTSGQQDPARSGTSENLYHCPNHPEVTATWPAKCPICGANLVRREAQESRPGTSGWSRAEEMRRRIMLNTSISVFDPEAILCARRPLGLTQEQVQKLQAISLAAREGARKILTQKQRNELTTMENLSNYPRTMAEMHRRMLQGQMPSSNSMMLDALLHQMRSRQFEAAGRSSSSRNPDPPAAGGADPQSTSNSLSARNRGTINTYSQLLQSDPFQQNTLNSLSARNRGDIQTYNQMLLNDPFQQSTLDSLRDTYRDQYRDRIRDNYRDQLRDNYRDFFRDQYRDSFGPSLGLGERFGNEGLANRGFGEGFGNQGFGEGFGNQGFGEGFGNEGFGEGFGNQGFGEGFGNRGLGEGFGGEGLGEGFGNEGLSGGFGNEGFGGARSGGEGGR